MEKNPCYNPPMPNGNNRQKIDKARAALLGIIPDPKGQVEQITTALVYKYLDKLDSDSVAIGGRRTYFVGSTAEFSWKNLLAPSLTGDQRLQLYRRAVEGMAESGKLGEVFGEMMRGASSPFQNARVLQTFLHAIDELDCDNTENLGDAYEHLLSIMGTQGDAGQFRTPRHIIDFIVAAVAPQKNERVLDPACGSAGFLVAAHAHVMRHGGTLSPADKRKLAQNIVGRDIDPGMARLAMVNLYLHKIKSPQVREYDSLSDDSLWEERADVILANPPFMTPRGGIQPHGRFMVRANRAEVLFVDYIAEHLSPQGRAGVIVPEGIIFQSGKAYKTLRKMLVEDWGLWAVASLPSGVFQPYTTVKTSVLFLDKTRRDFNNVLFVKIENDGFHFGAKRASHDKDDLPAALQILRNYKDEGAVNSPLAAVVAKDKIAEDEDDYSLVADNHREAEVSSNGKYPMTKLGDLIEEKRERVRAKNIKVFSVSNAKGFIDPSEQFGKRVASDNISNYKIVAPGDYAYNPARVNVGSIALNLSGDCGAVSPMYVVFRAKSEKLDSSYLLSLLKSKEGVKRIRAKAQGAIRQMLTYKGLSVLLIPLPSLSEQERIVAEIDGYTKVRDGADAVVQNWRPNVKINPAWPLVKLGDVVKVKKGDAITKSKTKKGDVPVIAGGRKAAYFHNQANRKGETITISGSGAYAGFVNFFDTPIFASDCSTIQSAKDGFMLRFLYCLLKTKQSDIYALSSGMAQPHVYPKHIQSLRLPLPPLAEQERIVAEVEAERRAVEECRALSATMEQKITNTIARIWEDKP